MKGMLDYLLAILVSVTWMNCLPLTAQPGRVEMNWDRDQNRVEVHLDGELFTIYRYGEELEKPVLFPLFAPGGFPVTRGYPLEPREGERVDHPHQAGLWLNFGDVNGYDFWNNSNAVAPDRKSRYGRVVHRELNGIRVEGDQGILEVTSAWMAPDTDQAELLLEERTTFVFSCDSLARIIDRCTRLTAVNREIVFTDNKEGMLAIRTARLFELPSDQPVVLTDSAGNPSGEAIVSHLGVNGWYRNSNGQEGHEVWGKCARWVRLDTRTGDQQYSIVIFDHPGNINYPSCWHARDYGLFSVNNLGRKSYNNELERFQFTLEKGVTLELRHRIVVAAAGLSDAETEAIGEDFIRE